MKLPFLNTKVRYIWWVLSVLLGALTGIFLTRTHFLDMPVPLVVEAIRPLMSLIKEASLSVRLEKSIVIIAVTSLATVPRAVIAGIVLGALACKTPYPRALLYSVIVGPMSYLVAQHSLLTRFEQGAKILGLPADHAVALQMELMQAVMFWIIVSLVFYTFAFIGYIAAKKISAHRVFRIKRSDAATA